MSLLSQPMQAIIERAFLYDPVRTENDLLKLGDEHVLTNVKADYRSGKLEEWHPRAKK